VEVHKLRREDKLYVVEPTSIVDAALEMVGALNFWPREHSNWRRLAAD